MPDLRSLNLALSKLDSPVAHSLSARSDGSLGSIGDDLARTNGHKSTIHSSHPTYPTPKHLEHHHPRPQPPLEDEEELPLSYQSHRTQLSHHGMPTHPHKALAEEEHRESLSNGHPRSTSPLLLLFPVSLSASPLLLSSRAPLPPL